LRAPARTRQQDLGGIIEADGHGMGQTAAALAGTGAWARARVAEAGKPIPVLAGALAGDELATAARQRLRRALHRHGRLSLSQRPHPGDHLGASVQVAACAGTISCEPFCSITGRVDRLHAGRRDLEPTPASA
jgi:hypothetical protein